MVCVGDGRLYHCKRDLVTVKCAYDFFTGIGNTIVLRCVTHCNALFFIQQTK